MTQTVTLDDATVKFEIWDTAGQEKFRSIIPTFLRDISVCIYVYDISRKSSFEHINDWVDFVKEQRGDDRSVLYYLIGNKSDLTDERQVSFEEGDSLSRSLGFMGFAEVSARTCTGVKELFSRIAAEIPSVPTKETPSVQTHLKVDYATMQDQPNNQSGYGSCIC